MLTNVKAGGIRNVEILCIENKAAVWGLSPSRRRPVGVRGQSPDAAAILQLFSKKYAFFKGIIWSKFRVFKWLNKVLMRPQCIRPRRVSPRFPSPPPSPCYATGHKSKYLDSTVAIVTLL